MPSVPLRPTAIEKLCDLETKCKDVTHNLRESTSLASQCYLASEACSYVWYVQTKSGKSIRASGSHSFSAWASVSQWWAAARVNVNVHKRMTSTAFSFLEIKYSLTFCSSESTVKLTHPTSKPHVPRSSGLHAQVSTPAYRKDAPISAPCSSEASHFIFVVWSTIFPALAY